MAKRKRLNTTVLPSGPLETKAYNGYVGVRAPIADVSADSATQAAFDAVADELQSARTEGRMIIKLPLTAIDTAHLVRDRVVLDATEMEVLRDSLRARGQQTPIEVVDLGEGRYGLISGWRRLHALQALWDETGETQFAQVQALVRQPDGAAGAYLAMVEENEIRADISFYERARIAVQAARQAIYPSTFDAVQGLFAAARAPKRSKIMAFTGLVEALDDMLRFPAVIPEKLGLTLAAALRDRPGFADDLKAQLATADITEAAQERAFLEAALRHKGASKSVPASAEVTAGIAMKTGRGKVTLSGAAVDAALVADLRKWLLARG